MSDTKFKIFKYELTGEEVQEIELPQAAQILELDFQPTPDGGVRLFLWAMVLPNQPIVRRRVVALATGEDVPDDIVEKFTHLKTFQMLTPRQDEEGNVFPKAIVMHYFLERGVAN
jgi:hypothetical protein